VNLTDNWNFNFDFLYGNTDAKFVASGMPTSPYSYDTDYFLCDFNVDYNILPDRLTPLVTAGIGVATIDMDAGYPGYGYSHHLSAGESNFSYNIGAGARWDITDNILIKLIYRVTWTQLEDANDNQAFSGVGLSIAYMF
jgi:opacity protein-like surface antigen